MPHKIEGIQIFKVGCWNRDDYSEADLDDMVVNFDSVGFQVPLKIGHSDDIGGPAFGWVSKIYRRGRILFADLRDVVDSVYKQIKNRQYDHVSAEIFFNLERAGKKFKRVLKALALLGAETPAVSALQPLRTVVHAASNFKSYSIDDVCAPYGAFGHLDFDEETTTMATNDPGSKLIELCRQYQQANPKLTDQQVFERVRNSEEGARLLRQYNEAHF